MGARAFWSLLWRPQKLKDSEQMVEFALAFAAGALTVAAPCVLPILPILLGASISQHSNFRPLFIVAGFILTFSGFAILFGTFSSVLGLSPETLREISIVLLVGFGLAMLWPQPFESLFVKLNGLFDRTYDVGRPPGSGNLGGLVLGLSLGVVWTPCAGPVLGSILTLIATSRSVAHAGVLLVGYAAGAGLPMVAIAYGGQYVTTRVRRLEPYSAVLQRAFGAAVVLVAIAYYTGYDTTVTVWLSNFYPNHEIGL